MCGLKTAVHGACGDRRLDQRAELRAGGNAFADGMTGYPWGKSRDALGDEAIRQAG